MKDKLSFYSVLAVAAIIFIATFLYYPKWKNEKLEKVITWDVAGYYQYLPATFIYKDLKKAAYLEDVLEKYQFTPENQQTRQLPNGNYVMKYAMGQAVMYSPFFLIGHIYALNSDFPADGFSTPYQLAIEFEILFFAFLGLWFFRLILLRYFSDRVAALTILGICLGSNYLEYASITGAMTHNNLFALYALLIYLVIRFKENPTTKLAIGIGLLVGLASLTRPTEVIAVLIPLFWGVSYPFKSGIKAKWKFILAHKIKYCLIFLFAGLIGMWQLIYWKYVSGDWFVYSYGKEGFDWFSPHLEDCFISMKAGWLVYSPLMILSLIGFYFLFKKYKSIFPVISIVSFIAIYIVISWQTWWYGGSLGQRALIQYYPLLAFPFAACVEQMTKAKWSQILLSLFFVSFIYYNIWLTHQVHRGGLVFVSQMRRTYFWSVVGRYDRDRNNLKFLDTNERFIGKRKNVNLLYSNDFENEDISRCHFTPIQGSNSPCLSSLDTLSIDYSIDNQLVTGKWIRAGASFYTQHRIWNVDDMGKLVVVFFEGEKNVKDREIKFHRQLLGGSVERIFIDVKCPDHPFDRVVVRINNGAINNLVTYDLLTIETFD